MGILDGKIALVTGAASGIGRATAAMFAQRGARVILADINEAAGREAAEATGAGAEFLRLDVTGPEEWQRARDQIGKVHGRLDILVNSAGICLDGDFLRYPLGSWRRTMAVNADGVFLGCQAAVAMMAAAGNAGSIVNICSVYGRIAADDVAAYAASKGAVLQLTKAVALYCAARGLPVRCNSVHPAFVDSEMLHGFAEAVGGHGTMVHSLTSVVPMRRMVSVAEVAEAVLFLASDASRMTTGGEITVDGGMLAGIIAPVTAPDHLVGGNDV